MVSKIPRKKKSEENKNDPKRVIKDLQEVINALLDCENENRECATCDGIKKNCMIFIRDSVAIALKFILDQMKASCIAQESEDLYV